MQFIVRIFDPATQLVTERVMLADSPDAVRQQVALCQLTVLSVTARGRVTKARHAPAFEVALFCEELSTLLSSGMTLVEAIDALCARQGAGSKQAILTALRAQLQEGKSLSDALQLSQYIFPSLLVASIRASERSSRLMEALDEYIAYDRTGKELGRKVVSSAIYPMLVVGFGLVVSLFMIAYVVPRFAKVYDESAHAISMPTLILMRVGQFVSDYLMPLLLGLVASVALMVRLYQGGQLKTLLYRMAAKSDTVHHYLRLYQLARVYQTMSMLMKGGFTVADAMAQAQALAFSPQLHASLRQARAAVLEGKRLSDAFAAHGIGDSVAERLLQVGERSGNMTKVMDIISTTCRQELLLYLERVTRLAEPLLLMAVGLMIGAIILLMYMPIFDLAGSL